MRKHFYVEDNKLKKYVHCIRGCKESYKQNDIGVTIFKANNTTYMCQKCIKTLKIDNDLTGTTPKHIKTLSVVESDVLSTNKVNEKLDEKQSELSIELETDQQQNTEEVLSSKKEHVGFIEQGEFSHFAIILLCKDATYCSGITTNPKKAISYHNQGNGSKHTKLKERRPVTLFESRGAFSLEEAKKIKNELNKKYEL